MDNLSNPRWRLLNGYKLIHRALQNHFVIYHSGSGDTHLLDEASMYILESLNDGALSQVELADKITAEYEIDSQDDLQHYISNALEELKQLAMVEKIG